MIKYFLLFDFEKVGETVVPNFINCVKVDDGFQRIDNLEKFILSKGEEGLGEEIINPRRTGYFQVTNEWKVDLEKTIVKFAV